MKELQPPLGAETLGLFARASVDLLVHLGTAALPRHLERLAALSQSDLVLLYEGLPSDETLDLVAAFGLSEENQSLFAQLGAGNVVGAGGHWRPTVQSWVPEAVDPIPPDLLTLGIRAFWSFPMYADDAYVGRLIIGSRRWDEFHEDALSVFAAAATQLALAVGSRRSALCRAGGVGDDGLADTNATQGRFIAVLAHELRNPIAPLRSGLDLLASGLMDAPARQELTSMMQRQLAHLVRLLDDLLDTVRVATGQLQAKREPVRLLEVIQAAIESVRPAIDAKHQTLQQTAVDEPMVVDADPVRLCQAFVNILSSSVKDTPAQGRIVVNVDRANEEWLITIQDENPRTGPDEAEHKLDPFPVRNWRLENGLAIGLGLVKGLLELNEGSAEVVPAAGAVGMVYKVRLPVSSLQAAPAAEAAAAVQQGWRSQRVLVVDDNRDAAATLGMLLELDGHTVRLAHDGPTAVAEAKEWQPDLILMDLGLPGFSGLEAARQIRSSASATRPIIIALTGWGTDLDRVATQEAGCDLHLVKPVAHEVLRRAFEAVTDKVSSQ